MKKFGLLKKSGDDGGQPSRNSQSSSSSNPYAQSQQTSDPYAQDTNKYSGVPLSPYQQAKASSYGGLPSGPGSGRAGGYGGPPAPAQGDYGSDRGYGRAQRGYGSAAPPGPSRGGYGSGSGSGPSRDGDGYGGGTGPTRGGYGSPAMNELPPSKGSGYGADRYGSGGGYGANRYDSGYGANNYSANKYDSGYGGSNYDGASATSSRGPGGYGGLGRSNSNETTTTDDNRNALFAGAKERYAQKTALPPPNNDSSAEHDSAASGSGGYGAYGEDRQLTAEEEEEEDVQATKQQIRFMKQEDVSSTRNALRIAAQAEETGRATLARLGAQGERIHNTEKNLDLAANHNRIAEEKARELKTLNKSMFAVHVANPFTSASRKAARDQDILDKHRAEREQRDATRQAAFGSQQRMENTFRDLQPGDVGYRPKQSAKASLAERSKYQFEADSEDDEMENEIDANLDALSGAAGRLNLLARATGQEVDEQNKHIDRIISKSDRVDDQIAMNRARLDRIH